MQIWALYLWRERFQVRCDNNLCKATIPYDSMTASQSSTGWGGKPGRPLTSDPAAKYQIGDVETLMTAIPDAPVVVVTEDRASLAIEVITFQKAQADVRVEETSFRKRKRLKIDEGQDEVESLGTAIARFEIDPYKTTLYIVATEIDQ